MWIGVVYAQEKRFVVLFHKLGGVHRVVAQFFAGKIRAGNLFEIERKSRRRVDMQLANDAGSVACLFQAPDQVRGVFPVEPKFPCGQADLAVLVRVKPG